MLTQLFSFEAASPVNRFTPDRFAPPIAAQRRQSHVVRPSGSRGFTLVELLVVVGLIGLLLAILLPTMSGVRRSGNQVKCLSNLRQITTGFLQFASDNRGVLPDPATANQSWEAILLPKIRQPAVFRCPSDEELFDTIGSSYDWRDTGEPLSTLAGQKLTMARSDAVLAFDSLPGWHAKRKMNASFIDGSVRTMTDVECLDNLSRPVRRGS